MFSTQACPNDRIWSPRPARARRAGPSDAHPVSTSDRIARLSRAALSNGTARGIAGMAVNRFPVEAIVAHAMCIAPCLHVSSRSASISVTSQLRARALATRPEAFSQREMSSMQCHAAWPGWDRALPSVARQTSWTPHPAPATPPLPCPDHSRAIRRRPKLP